MMKKNYLFLLIVFVLNCFLAFAQSGTALLAPYTAGAPEIVSRSGVLVDFASGTLLYAKNPNEEIPPASLTKLMTMHLVMNAVSTGKASLDEIVPIGKESWAQSQPPRSSLMFLASGQTVTLREIMLGLAVSSGNDAAVACAMRLAPSVPAFAELMNNEARRLGLSHTRFVEPSGISEENMTTAAEYAAFCREYMRLHPQATAEFHSVPEFAYPKAANVDGAFGENPKTIVQYNRNALLKTFPGVDGLKTGYIDEAGYNIALTAQRNGTRFVLVLMGAPAHSGGDRIRDADGERLLDWAFKNFKTVRPDVDPIKEVRLWKSKSDYAMIELAGPPVFTAPVERGRSLRTVVELDEPLVAPLPAAYPVGSLVIFDEEGELHRVTLQTAGAYEQGNIFKRFWHSIRLLFHEK
jgi:D-alanyl-D-alanine carboxypeptidase (penicillin-binding protein 5/6)